MNPLKTGDKAPQFSLPDQDGEIINLSDFYTTCARLFLSKSDDTRLYKRKLVAYG